MTSDIKMLPLPDTCYRIGGTDDQDAWDAEQVTAHAHAVAEHNVAARDAEIERLRAEREVIGAEAVKYADKSGRLEAKVELLAEALRECINFLPDRGVPGMHKDTARAALRDHDQEATND